MSFKAEVEVAHLLTAKIQAVEEAEGPVRLRSARWVTSASAYSMHVADAVA
jgi:hypothetical protein